MDKNKILFVLGIILLVLVPFLGNVHLFDWDEINFAECAREMVSSGSYETVTIDYQPFWEKPPLFIWMQAMSMKIFGINEFAARFPNVLAGIATIFSLLYHGSRQHSMKFAWWWSALYLGSFLPNVYFHSGIIDPWFNLFIFNSISFYIIGTQKKNWSQFALAGCFAGLATMTKGPVTILLIGMPLLLFHIFLKFKDFPKIKNLIIAMSLTILVGSIWFFTLFITGNKEIIGQFIDYQIRLFQTKDAGHGGPMYYHLIVLLFGCFPASFLALGNFKISKKEFSPYKKAILILGLFTLILFSLVQTKIIHYSSLCYFPITYFAADFWVNSSETIRKKILFICSLIIIIFGLILALLVSIQLFTGGIEHYINIKDDFAKANLSANIKWDKIDFLAPFIFISLGVLSIFAITKNKIQKALSFLLSSIAVGIVILLATILPHIESYTQGAAIQFYQSHKDKNVYLIPLGFKSYAHFYYGEVKPHKNPLRFEESWICSPNTDLPVYYVSKKQTKNYYLSTYPNLILEYEKNGFVFYRQRENLISK